MVKYISIEGYLAEQVMWSNFIKFVVWLVLATDTLVKKITSSLQCVCIASYIESLYPILESWLVLEFALANRMWQR